MNENSKSLYYGFYIVAAMVMLMLPASLIMSASSIFFLPVSQEFGVSLASFGMNNTIIQLTCAVGVPLVFSRIAIKFKMRYVLTMCLIIEVLMFALRALSVNMWMFYVSSFFLAIPMAMFFNLSIPILMNAWFPMSAGKTIGIVGAAQGLGGMIFSTLGGLIIQNYDWRICFWVFAGISLIMIPFALIVIRNSPAEKQLQPLIPKNLKETGVNYAEVSGVDAKKARSSLPFFLLLIAFPISAFVGNFNSYVNAYAQTVGLSIAAAGAIAGILQLGTLFYKLTIGAVSDKNMKGGFFYYAISSLVAFVLFLLGGANTVLIVVSCFLFGSIGASVNLYGPLIVKYVFGTKDFTKLWASIVGLFTMFGAFGATLWGVIVERTSYQVGFMIAASLIVVLTILMSIIFSQREKMKDMWTVANDNQTHDQNVVNK